MSKKWFYYVTGFFSGMSVMAIELGASRLLAPYFSSSQIVWTIIIGTIMIAMALGNIIGGKMADKYKNPDRLFILLLAAATWTMLIPVCGKFIISGIALLLALFVNSNYLIWAALLSCLVVFVFPLLILGMVTPNIIKYATTSLENNGKVVGKIEALNTIGSIIGTFLPTFVTIPTIGTTLTFVIFASILYIICIVYFAVRRKNIVKTTVIAVLSLSLGIASNGIGTAFWDSNILYEGESIYNYLRVEETEDSYILSTNVLFGVQSVKMKTPGLTGMYYDYALAAPLMAGGLDNKLDILILGLGTGTFATQCYEYFDDINVDGVEIDSKIVSLAKKYFDLPAEVNTYIGDGRAFIDRCDKKYDVIMVDAYQDITIPFQMSSVEFFTSVREHLKTNGIMVVNMNMYTSNEGGINDYLLGTITSTFSDVYKIKTNGTNVEVFASQGFNCSDALDESFENIDDADLKSMMYRVKGSLQKCETSQYILTDDKAPVEILGMGALDIMIVDEIKYYREMIKRMSLKEIFDLLMSGKLF